MSATIERKPTNLAPTASADSITCGFSSFFTSFAGSNFVDEKISTMSVKQDGGKIIPRKTTNDLIRITVFYEGGTETTEDYVFQLDNKGDGMVAWTAIRTASAKNNKMSVDQPPLSGPGGMLV